MPNNNIPIDKQIQKYINQMYEFHNRNKKSIPVSSINVPSMDSSNNSPTESTYSSPQKRPGCNKIDNPQDFFKYEDGLVSSKNGEKLYEEYKKLNPEKGYLQVQTLAARRTYPVPSAKVTVLVLLDDNEKYVISTTTTDSAGLTPVITLPATQKYRSETPECLTPYTSYTVVVEHPDFLPMIFYNVPIFEDIVSSQTADLVLKSVAAPGQTKIEVMEEEPTSLY